jgi:ferredoxin-NADP reductase/predicted pyridoxine 5'-phosphate oxidase superfamily flavin-nucleotide-binding protein
MTAANGPFHAGELEAQRRAGAGDIAVWAGGLIRDHMPGQHRDFFATLPFVVLAAADAKGRPWVTIVEGHQGFVRSPGPRNLSIAAPVPFEDPLAGALVPGAAVGVLGIELATRRRNRLNGMIRATDDGLAIEVQQSFGNCPQYIQAREWHRVAASDTPRPRVADTLDADQRALIAAADTLFVGTGVPGVSAGRTTDGYDASHRGGPLGFVRVAEDGTLRIPDYSGNMFFNTLGNLIRDPRIGLVLVEFATGRLLHISGRARIEWEPAESHDPNAQRMIVVTVDAVVDRPGALALRWRDEDRLRRLRVVRKVRESERITSFELAPDDGRALAPFVPGQHLPVEMVMPGQPDRVRRSYSLSRAPGSGTYRISVKLESRGIASGFLHTHAGTDTVIEARRPSGGFVMPGGADPMVLVSAGVGITPLLAILHAAVAERPGRQIWFVHGARDGQNQAFKDEVDALTAARPSIRRRVFYSAPQAAEVQGVHFDSKGRIAAQDLLALEAGARARYMICGPASFLADLRSGLERAGVPPDHILVETFGPTG